MNLEKNCKLFKMKILRKIVNKNIIWNFKRQYASTLTWLMLGLGEKNTGLPVRIYVSEKLDIDRGTLPSIKVQNNYSNHTEGKCFLVSIEDDPKIITGKAKNIKQEDLEKIFMFIKVNKNNLLSLWNYEIDQMSFAEKLELYTNGN